MTIAEMLAGFLSFMAALVLFGVIGFVFVRAMQGVASGIPCRSGSDG